MACVPKQFVVQDDVGKTRVWACDVRDAIKLHQRENPGIPVRKVLQERAGEDHWRVVWAQSRVRQRYGKAPRKRR